MGDSYGDLTPCSLCLCWVNFFFVVWLRLEHVNNGLMAVGKQGFWV